MWYLNIYVIFALLCAAIILTLLKPVSGRHFAFVRQLVLLIFSIGFLYMFGRKLVFFYLAYTLAGYVICRLVTASAGYRKLFFSVGIVFNLSIFLIYRLIDTKIAAIPAASIFLAVGLAYNFLKAIDALYMAYFAEERIRFINYVNYMLFIPTFTSGPILRYRDFAQDSPVPVRLESAVVEASIKRIIKGLFKKVVLVEPLMVLYNARLESAPHFYNSILILVVFYILLFFDFSGYSDIAIGFGTLLGYRIPENFKKPFTSPTLTQFWRNWHASLGDWFRDHIFVFMIKSKKSRLFAGGASFVIMAVIGIWHGFAPLLILWGLYHGFLLFMENILNMTTINRKKTKPVVFYARCLVVNIFIAFGTIFFSKDVNTAIMIFTGFFKW